ncbi:MAG TPA: DUF916 domain-containing protein [Intrasporangium sp.]|uniref:WxL protein peptidoglycan domain-containing protein n=1 Tax=Intrasporangium sp. TaxID=1925024 RepID=UPI002D7707A2|nr:DUF916 domain-containing protein [Intrasporangium sp.]HET7399539.1 DUF916 domain-containing protein [Intrasporangium sp.]
MLGSLTGRASAVLLTIGCLLGLSAGPSTAASTTPAAQPVKLSLKPAGQAGAYFDLVLRPGETKPLKVELGNNAAVPLAARTYAADAYTIINGGFGARDRNSRPTGTTTWLRYANEVVQLPPGRAQLRSFTVAVPRGTAPGQYLTSLVLENDQPVKGSGAVALDQVIRQAVAVSIRVPGAARPALRLGGAGHTVAAEHSVVRVKVTNAGNMNLKPAGTLVIHDDTGRTVSQAPITMGSFYAHDTTSVEATLGGKLAPGQYTADLTLTDAPTKVTAKATGLRFTVAAPVSNTSGGAAVGRLPEILQGGGSVGPYLAAAGVLLVLALLLVRRRARRRRS